MVNVMGMRLPHSALPTPGVGAPLTSADVNTIVQALLGSLKSGEGIQIERVGSVVTIKLDGYRPRIIPTGGGGTQIHVAANKTALDLITVAAPAFGWTEDTKIMYERTQNSLGDPVWLPGSRWRKVILP